jgi:hypothetical protein
MNNLTLKGWFYFVPVWLSENGEDICMRWTYWQFPVLIACYIHNLMNTIFGREDDFPIYVTGVRK